MYTRFKALISHNFVAHHNLQILHYTSIKNNIYDQLYNDYKHLFFKNSLN